MNQQESPTSYRKVLFLCSGNYYRSRFAEILFNLRAEAVGLDWRADSRAVDLPGSRPYIRGPISPFCVEGLAARGIHLDGDIRFPIQVAESDLTGCDLAIAMKETEHRAPLERAFPASSARVEYWNIHDIDCAEPVDALAILEMQIEQLLHRLARGKSGGRQAAG